MRRVITILIMTLASSVSAQQVTVNLTHDASGTVFTVEPVEFTLSYTLSGFPPGSVLSGANQRIIANDPALVVSRDFTYSPFPFNGGTSSGLSDNAGGIDFVSFTNSLFLEAFGEGPADTSNPLVAGSFTVYPQSFGTLAYDFEIGQGAGAFVSVGTSAFTSIAIPIEDVTFNIQPLQMLVQPPGVLVNLTHNAVEPVLIGQPVEFTLSYTLSGFPPGSVLSGANQRIIANDPALAVSSDFAYNGPFNGGTTGGLSDGAGGIDFVSFSNSLFIEEFGGGPADTSRPLVAGSFTVYPQSLGTLTYDFDIGQSTAAFVAVDISAFNAVQIPIEDVTFNIQPLQMIIPQEVLVNLTHNAIEPVVIGQPVEFTLSYGFSGFPAGSVLAGANQQIIANDPALAVSSDFAYNGPFNGGTNGGLSDGAGGISFVNLTNSFVFEAFGGDPPDASNPLVAGSFTVYPQSLGTLAYFFDTGQAASSFVAVELSLFNEIYISIEDVTFNIQSLHVNAISEDLKLVASDGVAEDHFGNAIAFGSKVIAVGASFADGNNAGAVYLYDIANGAEIAKLQASDGAGNDLFGESLDIDGGILAVGAYLNDDVPQSSGSAYLFNACSGAQTAKLLPDDLASGDLFGISIGIDNGIVAVGAYGNDEGGSQSGAVYLFDAVTGTQTTKILASDGAVDDNFGNSLAINNGVLAVGAWHSNANGTDSGAAYLFDATTGIQIVKLLPNDGAAGDLFGRSIAVGDGIVAVTSDRDTATGSGSVYLFDSATGAQITKLSPNDGAPGGFWGYSVSVDKGVVAIGARHFDGNGPSSGSAYLYDAGTGDLIKALIASDEFQGDFFGSSIAISNGLVAVGAVNDDDGASASGSVYLFDFYDAVYCPADMNGDGVIDNGDIGAFIAAFLAGGAAADFTGDCILDNGDIQAFLTAFLAGC